MVNDSKKKMLNRIRAMMNVEGRTEAEMLAFLAKARELMAAYDIVFATWLLDTLQRFVMRALRNHQKQLIKEKGANHSNRLTSASFVVGCCSRINEKLKELAPINWATTQDLIVKELNMSLVKSRGPSAKIHEASAMAGAKAGDSARFDRPVGQGGRILLK